MNHKRFFLYFAICLLAGGCAPVLTPQTKATISQTQQTTAIATAKAQSAGQVAVAKAKAQAALNQEKGQESPVLHPVAAANNLVVEIRPWLIAITLIAFVLWAIQFGLSFTSLSFLNFFAPVLRWVSILSLVALLSLPFLPWAFIAVFAAIMGLVVYELVKDRGNVVSAVTDAETVLGVHLGTAGTSTAAPPASATLSGTLASGTLTAHVTVPAAPAATGATPATAPPAAH